MDDQITQPLPPEESHRNGSTGPTSPDGKSRSSMNRLTHGCCSEKTVLPDEDPGEFESAREAWYEQYGPEEGVAALLVEETALAHWFLKRARRRLEGVEWELPADPNSWTEANEKRFEKFTRYKTTAERAFSRNFRELEAHYDRIVRGEHALRLADVKLAAIHMKWLTREEEKTVDARKVEQVAQVEIVDGKCKTTYYPTNQQLIGEIATRPKLPLFVTRWIQFPEGVPAEYGWSNPDEVQQFNETTAVQKMTYRRWLQLIEVENLTGHIGSLLWPKPA